MIIEAGQSYTLCVCLGKKHLKTDWFRHINSSLILCCHVSKIFGPLT